MEESNELARALLAKAKPLQESAMRSAREDRITVTMNIHHQADGNDPESFTGAFSFHAKENHQVWKRTRVQLLKDVSKELDAGWLGGKVRMVGIHCRPFTYPVKPSEEQIISDEEAIVEICLGTEDTQYFVPRMFIGCKQSCVLPLIPGTKVFVKSSMDLYIDYFMTGG